MATYTINSVGSTTCNYPSTVNENDVLRFNVTKNVTSSSSNSTGTMLTYTFPCDCTAEIRAAGAKGGKGAGSSSAGGRGAIVAGTLSFVTGDQLLICVGQAGTDNTYTSGSDGTTGAGGGGTYVVKKVSSSSYLYTGSGTGNNWYVEPLVIGAGGNGGGDALYSGNYTIHASSSNGNESTFTYSTSTYYHGGGFSNCAQSSDATSGRSFLTGASGATDYYTRSGTSYAGFGGGGSNRDDGSYGGGGGGFTGGNQNGTAATSYVIGSATNISRLSGASNGNDGQGYVEITIKTITPAIEFPPSELQRENKFNTKVKVSNAWKNGDKGYVKVNNAWKQISKMYTKVNGTWVSTMSSRQLGIEQILYEGYANTNLPYYGEFIGDMSYTGYVPGAGIFLSKAAGNWMSNNPAAVGYFDSMGGVTGSIARIELEFTRASGSGAFDIGVCLSSDTYSYIGNISSTVANNLIKATESVNANSGTVVIDLEAAFGDKMKTTYSNYYFGLYYSNSATAASSIVIDNIKVYLIPETILPLYYGVLDTETPLGNYTGHNTYSKYTAGTGISLYKTGSTYIAAAGYFNNKNVVNKISQVIINYKRTSGSGSYELGVYASTTGQANRLNTTSYNGLTKVGQTLSNDTGQIVLDLEYALGANYESYNNHYLGIYLYASGSAASTVVITDIFYIERGQGSNTQPPSGGEGSSTPQTIKLIENGIVNTNTIFGSLLTDNKTSQFQENVSISGSKALKMKLSPYDSSIYNTASFGNLIDASNIQSISITWAPQQTNTTNPFTLYVSTSNTAITASELGPTTLGGYFNNVGYISPDSLSPGILWTTTEVETYGDWSGQGYLTLAGSYYDSSSTYLMIKDLVVTTKGSSGGNTGGSSGGNGLTLREGYYTNGEFKSDPGYDVCTDKINVKSLSNSTTFTFTITPSISKTAFVYIPVWSSDGTQGTYIDILDLGRYDFVANRPVEISLTKNQIATELDLSSSSDVGHVALWIYSDTIYAQNFTVTYSTGGSSGGGSNPTIQATFYSGLLDSNGASSSSSSYMYSGYIAVSNYTSAYIECNYNIDYIAGYDSSSNFVGWIVQSVNQKTYTANVANYSYIRFDVKTSSGATATITLS